MDLMMGREKVKLCNAKDLNYTKLTIVEKFSSLVGIEIFHFFISEKFHPRCTLKEIFLLRYGSLCTG